MKPVNTDLYDLIQSLSHGEKYFLSKTKLGDAYARIFELVDNQEFYDEEAILKRMPGIPRRQYAVMKKQLYNRLLEVLNNYHSEKTVYAKILKNLQSIKQLYVRKLYSQAMRMVVKSEEMAAKYEYEPFLQELLLWKLKLAYAAGKDVIEGDPFIEMMQSTDRMDRRMKLEKLSWEMFWQQYSSLSVRSDHRLQELKQLIADLLMTSEAEFPEFRSKELFYFIYALYYRIAGDLPQSYQYRLKRIEVFEDYPHILQEEPGSYIYARLNRLNISTLIFPLSRVLSEAQELREIPARFNLPETDKVVQRAFASTYFIELEMMLILGKFEGAFKKAAEMRKELTRRKIKVYPATRIRHLFAYAYASFGVRNYRDAIRWVNEIMNLKLGDQAIDFQLTTRIMAIIIHYEMKNYQLVSSLNRSTSRWLRQLDSPHRFEKLTLKYLDRFFSINNYMALRQSFKNLRKELLVLQKDPNEQRVFVLFDFISWLDSKIEGLSFDEVVRISAKNNKLSV